MSHKIKSMLYDLYGIGCDTFDIAQIVMHFLGEYFQNPNALRKAVTRSEILSALEFEIRYHHEPEFHNGVIDVLNCYRAAHNIDSIKTLELIIFTLGEVSEKENQMWTVRNNAPKGIGEDLYDSVSAYMKHIGDSLEISTKHIIYEIYALIRVSHSQSIDYEKIYNSEFGKIINNILMRDKLEYLLKTEPINIKLSDWRNIAYHHSYSIKNNLILCEYGRPKKQFSLTLNEFATYAHQIIRTTNVFNIARCIYVYDNLDAIIQLRPNNLQPFVFRRPMLIEQLRISFMSQGFVLNEYEETDESVIITLIDTRNNGTLNDDELRKRQIHSSQFLYNIWCVFKSESIKVVYCSNDGIKVMESSVSGEICQSVLWGKPISHMVSHVTFKHFTSA